MFTITLTYKDENIEISAISNFNDPSSEIRQVQNLEDKKVNEELENMIKLIIKYINNNQ